MDFLVQNVEEPVLELFGDQMVLTLTRLQFIHLVRMDGRWEIRVYAVETALYFEHFILIFDLHSVFCPWVKRFTNG